MFLLEQGTVQGPNFKIKREIEKHVLTQRHKDFLLTDLYDIGFVDILMYSYSLKHGLKIFLTIINYFRSLP